MRMEGRNVFLFAKILTVKNSSKEACFFKDIYKLKSVSQTTLQGP